ncbi:MAG: HPF/RaiA family ribosome-associated protein [Planctomycetota bacterium]
MLIKLHRRNGKLTRDIERLAKRRIQFALSRFESQIDQVEVVVGDENGPRGGCDQSCQLVISLRQGVPVVIRQLDESFARGISLAADRARQTVSRRLDRLRRSPRQRIPVAEAMATDLSASELPAAIA